jgi:hypothetical protein
MIGLDLQITRQVLVSEKSGNSYDKAILLSLRRLKRIEELMREPSERIIEAGCEGVWLQDSLKLMSAALLKQVEEEVK